MQNLAALSAAVFSLSTQKREGADNRPGRARVKLGCQQLRLMTSNMLVVEN